MSIALNASWLAEMRRPNVTPIKLIAITDGTSTWKMVSGDTPLFGYPNSVIGTSPIQIKADVFERVAQGSTMDVALVDDGYFKSIVTANRLKNQKITIYSGTPNLSEANFEEIWGGAIDDITMDGTEVVIRCKDVLALMADREVRDRLVTVHPLEGANQIRQKVGIPSSLWSVSVPSANEHLNITMMGTNEEGAGSFFEPQSARSLVSALIRLVDGMLVQKPDGAMKYVAYDEAASSVATLTGDDIADLEVISTMRNLYNRISVEFGYGDGYGARVTTEAAEANTANKTVAARSGQKKHELQINNAASQSAYAFPGESTAVIERSIRLDLIDAEGQLLSDIPASGGTTFTVYGSPNLAGWCGADTARPLSSTNTAYVKIEDEIIECSGLTVTNGPSVETDPETGATVNTSVPLRGVFTIKTRGVLGTSAAAHTHSTATRPILAFDYTIAAIIGESRLNRFRDGAPEIRVRTRSLEHHAIEMGDFIQITYPDLVFSYLTGDSLATETWEVVGKEFRDDDDSPGIVLDLVMVRTTLGTNSFQALARKLQARSARSLYQMTIKNVEDAARPAPFNPGKQRGLIITQDSGLNGTLSAGLISAGISSAELYADVAITFTASKDSWVYIDAFNANVYVEETAVSASEPDMRVGMLLVGKVTTDGSGITAIDQSMLEDGVVTGARLVASTLRTRAIDTGSAISRSLLVNHDFGHFSRG